MERKKVSLLRAKLHVEGFLMDGPSSVLLTPACCVCVCVSCVCVCACVIINIVDCAMSMSQPGSIRRMCSQYGSHCHAKSELRTASYQTCRSLFFGGVRSRSFFALISASCSLKWALFFREMKKEPLFWSALFSGPLFDPLFFFAKKSAKRAAFLAILKWELIYICPYLKKACPLVSSAQNIHILSGSPRSAVATVLCWKF